jgi:hypothetical protein
MPERSQGVDCALGGGRRVAWIRCFIQIWCGVALLQLLGTSIATADAEGKKSAHPAESLTAQAGDPTAPLLQVQFTNTYIPNVHLADGYSNLLEFEPVLPLPKSELVPVDQVIRLTVPLITSPKPDRETGIGDVSLFDILVASPESWGIWGIGPVLVADSASDDKLGSGKWQLGPAATVMYYGVKNWQIGAVFQNPISFAGDHDRDAVNQLQIQPVINYLWGDWYFGAGDLNITFDWEQSGELTLPLALQAGRIIKIGKYSYNLSAEFAWTAVHPDDVAVPDWGIKLGFVWLFPE